MYSNIEKYLKKVNVKEEKNSTPTKKHTTLKERMADYKLKYKGEEWDTGNPQGNEEG